MVRFLIILALVVQVTFPTARCVAIANCAMRTCDADQACPIDLCETQCCDAPEQPRCEMACSTSCEDERPGTPAEPSPCPSREQCQLCCVLICRFDPVQAITGPKSGHPSTTSPSDIALGALLGAIPSYPVITVERSCARPPIASCDLPPPVCRVDRPAICVWTI